MLRNTLITVGAIIAVAVATPLAFFIDERYRARVTNTIKPGATVEDLADRVAAGHGISDLTARRAVREAINDYTRRRIRQGLPVSDIVGQDSYDTDVARTIIREASGLLAAGRYGKDELVMVAHWANLHANGDIDSEITGTMLQRAIDNAAAAGATADRIAAAMDG